MVAFELHLAGEIQKGKDGGDEHRRSLPAPTHTNKTTDRLCEEQRSRRVRRIHPHTQARNVHALGHHADRDHPLVIAFTESINAVGVIGKNHRRRTSRDVAQMTGVGAGLSLIRCDDQAASVRDLSTHLLEAQIGGAQNRRDPLAFRVEGGPPRLLHHVFREGLTQAGAHLIARVRPPGHLPRIRHEEHRTDDALS